MIFTQENGYLSVQGAKVVLQAGDDLGDRRHVVRPKFRGHTTVDL